jgi:hypothetical protein
MLRSSLVLLAFTVTFGAAQAAAPENRPVLITWSLMVKDDAREKHEYVPSRDGGPIKLDVADWKCRYDSVHADPSGGLYMETRAVICTTGKSEVASPLSCFSKAVGGEQSAILVLNARGRSNTIVMTCAPQPN